MDHVERFSEKVETYCDDRERKSSFSPVFASNAGILILGSLPGDASLGKREYYGHPRNAFWRIMGERFHFDPAEEYEVRLELLRRSRLAVWDVVSSGIRPGSLDSDIRAVVPNDIPGLVASLPELRRICCNGGASHSLLKRFFPELWKSSLEIIQLPSTSPAAARLSYEEKRKIYFDSLNDI